jgi:hypothetical protein
MVGEGPPSTNCFQERQAPAKRDPNRIIGKALSADQGLDWAILNRILQTRRPDG